ncbi:MAG TPA: ATP-binding cassette domain-containing protein [Pirellulales bacterium]|jgi:ABC-type sugar transport system ATPase subunit|nr:ATP-binding cassette domain-containing protein [Pirellulales bacterium]
MIAVQNLSLRQGAFALEQISFEILPGEYAVLMGRTGSGKTSILEAICGLRPISGGQIRLADRDVTAWKPAQRGIGYVPQDRSLFSTLTVRANLAFALEVRRWKRAEIDRRVDELAELLGLGALLERLPGGLSGGEAQRVALGRALAMRPSLMLLDEPLTALDQETREEMLELLANVHRQTGLTALHVTHHPGDADRLADRRFVLQNGTIASTLRT